MVHVTVEPAASDRVQSGTIRVQTISVSSTNSHLVALRQSIQCHIKKDLGSRRRSFVDVAHSRWPNFLHLVDICAYWPVLTKRKMYQGKLGLLPIGTGGGAPPPNPTLFAGGGGGAGFFFPKPGDTGPSTGGAVLVRPNLSAIPYF
jgi:hypothetical protein